MSRSGSASRRIGPDCFNTAAPVCPAGRTAFHAECVGPTPNVVEAGRLFDTMERPDGKERRRLAPPRDEDGRRRRRVGSSFEQAPDSLFERIDQLVVEFHATGEDRFVGVVWRLKHFFHVAHIHFNNRSCETGEKPFPAWAYEVLLVSKRLARLDASGRRPGRSPLDAPNDPDASRLPERPLMSTALTSAGGLFVILRR